MLFIYFRIMNSNDENVESDERKYRIEIFHFLIFGLFIR
jgi:hypothetical protein